MDMVLVADEPGRASPEFRIASTSRRIEPGDFMLPSLEVAGPGGHWVEVSRAIKAGADPNAETLRMAEAYEEYAAVAPAALKAGGTAHDAHRAVARPFADRGYTLGHVTGHSIGMTMIEFPKIGEGVETVLEENMVLSVHPARHLGGRPFVPLHAGDVARHEGGRRAALRHPHADLRRRGVSAVRVRRSPSKP